MISFDQFKYQKKCIPKLMKPKVICPDLIQPKVISPKLMQPKVISPKLIQPNNISSNIISSKLPIAFKEDIQIAIPVDEKKIENVSYIYLIREREHYLNDKPIYKFGRSTQLPDHKINRLYHYKKGSEIILVLQCKNVVETENKIRVLFKQNFIQHIDGHEHYYGDVNQMKKIIWEVINI
jgi:hypothetical protein